jgi:hypothetical protein
MIFKELQCKQSAYIWKLLSIFLVKNSYLLLQIIWRFHINIWWKQSPHVSKSYHYKGLLSFWTMSTICYSTEHTTSETRWFCPQVKGWEARTLLDLIERANLSHWTLCSFEQQMMDKIQKLNNCMCYKPLSEHFKIICPVGIFTWIF